MSRMARATHPRPAHTDGADVIDWLVSSAEPAIARMARRDLLDEEPGDLADLGGPLVGALLEDQHPDGGFGMHPYGKWRGAHWRLVSLVELEIPPGEPQALRALDTVLEWLTSSGHRRRVPVIAGLTRRCGSQEGNALAVASRLGQARDTRVQLLAESLIEWQWPDGGWNCDVRPEAHRSSFHETLPPIWALHEYSVATGDRAAAEAARRGAELILEHRVFRSLTTGEPMSPHMLVIHYPPYWHYDFAQALLVLWRMDLIRDPRTGDALDHLRELRRRDGTWRPGRRWWRAPGTGGTGVEAVDWGEFADQMVTLNALRALSAAGRRDGEAELNARA